TVDIMVVQAKPELEGIVRIRHSQTMLRSQLDRFIKILALPSQTPIIPVKDAPDLPILVIVRLALQVSHFRNPANDILNECTTTHAETYRADNCLRVD